MKLVNLAFIVATVGYGALCLGCAPKALDPAVAQAEELKIDDPYWHRISPLPNKDGFYKMYDHEDGRICYIIVTGPRGRIDKGVSLECQYNEEAPVVEEQRAVDMRVSAVRFDRWKEPIERPRPKCTRNKPCVIPKPCLPKWPSCVA